MCRDAMETRVIVASGEDPLDVGRAFAGRGVVQFLPKPFKIQTLLAAVKSALGDLVATF